MKAVIGVLLALFKTIFKKDEGSVVVEKELEPVMGVLGPVVYEILNRVMAGMGDSEAAIYLPDNLMKAYNKQEVMDSNHLIEVSAITYVTEVMDCDDFAAKLYGRFAGLVWTNKHALNWFIDEAGTFWWIDAKAKKLSQTLEGWQGTDIRFFLAR